MLVSPNEITWMQGKNFLPIEQCPPQVKCSTGNCYARSFTFTPKSISCNDMINGSKKDNVFKVIRPQKDKFVDGDTSYFNTNDTCCIHWVDTKDKEYKNGKLGNHTCITEKGKLDKYCKETLDEIKQPYTANVAFIWMFMALLATLMVLVDFFRAMYEKCGVSEWINVTLQARMADPVKSKL